MFLLLEILIPVLSLLENPLKGISPEATFFQNIPVRSDLDGHPDPVDPSPGPPAHLPIDRCPGHFICFG